MIPIIPPDEIWVSARVQETAVPSLAVDPAARIRLARLDRVPYKIVPGQMEVDEGTVSIRRRDREKLTTMTLEDFIARMKLEIPERSL